MPTTPRYGISLIDGSDVVDFAALNAIFSLLDDSSKLTELSTHTGNTSNPHGVTAVQSGAVANSAGAVTDTLIGTRTPNDTIVPAAGGQLYSAIVNMLANAVKRITGEASWLTAPATTLALAAAHFLNTSNPHSTTAAQAGAVATGATYTATPTNPASSGPFSLQQWWDRLTGQLVRITGETNWYDIPANTIKAIQTYLTANVIPHLASTSNPHSVTAAQAGAIATTARGAANGVAPLDASSKVPVANLPTLASFSPVIPPGSWVAAVTSAPQWDVYSGFGNWPATPAWRFDSAGGNEGVYLDIPIPANTPVADVRLRVEWFVPTTQAATNVKWQVGAAAVDNGAAFNAAVAATATVTTATDTAGDRVVSELQLDEATIGLAVGKKLRLKLFRDSADAADTYTSGDVYFTGAELTFA